MTKVWLMRTGLLIAIMLFALHGYAKPKDYIIVLRVTHVDQASAPSCGRFFLPLSTFGCTNAAGDIHLGRFTIDDALLMQEGENLPGTITNFSLEISPTTWDQKNPVPATAFMGFRGPVPPAPLVLFAPSPGFDVHKGKITGVKGRITGLQGGVFGPGDFPFVDFQDTDFSAADVEGTHLTGTLLVAPVPLHGPNRQHGLNGQ